MIEGLVSTVIPVFNRAAMLREAVGSVWAQTWRPIEIIIVDDGSTDDTPEAIRELRAEHPDVVRVLTQSNAGPGSARQAGLEVAQGEFVQFLDSDDLLMPEKFSLQVSGLRRDAEAGISYGKTYTRLNGVLQAAPAQRSAQINRNLFPALLAGRLWETSTPLYRARELQKIGQWPAKRQMEDWEFDAKAGAAGVKLHYCDAWVAEYRIHNEHRLAHAWMTRPAAMRDRLLAHVEVLRCARQANVPVDAPEIQRFARTLFSVARTAGVHGFTPEAEQLLALAQELSGKQAIRALEIRTYGQLARIFGWAAIGRLSQALGKIA